MFEFSGKGTTLFGEQAPLSGEHSRLNGGPVSLDYKQGSGSTPKIGGGQGNGMPLRFTGLDA